ncbi:LytR C-terminal domain-containing protein [bacterium]|nr:LytR C-terminal domain-containing protein [bacterium]
MTRRRIRSVSKRKLVPKRKPVRSSSGIRSQFLNLAIGLLVVINLVLLGSFVYKYGLWEKWKAAIKPVQVTTVQEVSVGKIIRVQVLNGCGVRGIADRFADVLRRQNFDVVDINNYRSFNVDSSLVLDRSSLNMMYGKKLAKVLGIPFNRVQPKINPDLQLEATVIIGKDFRSLKGYLNKQLR